MAVPSRSPRRHWLRYVVVTGLLLAVRGGINAYIANNSQDERPLNTVIVTRGDLQVRVTATGELEPSEFVDMGAQVSDQLAMLDAQIEQTSSTLRPEEANPDYAKIYAPMDGTVVFIDAREGQALNSSQQVPLLRRIADLATMRVRANMRQPVGPHPGSHWLVQPLAASCGTFSTSKPLIFW